MRSASPPHGKPGAARAAQRRPIRLAEGWRTPPVQPGGHLLPATGDRRRCRLAHGTRAYARYAKQINDQSGALCTLRGLFKLKTLPTPIPLDRVEPARQIVKRFCTGAMSLGSISTEAHETLAMP